MYEPSPNSPARQDVLQDARECLALEEQYRAVIEHDWLWRLRKAILLAPTIDVCEALLRGEQVPLDKLDQEAVRRTRRRP